MVKTLPSIAGLGRGWCRFDPQLGAKIPHNSQPKDENIKQKQHCNNLNKDFKNGPHPKKKKKDIQSWMVK